MTAPARLTLLITSAGRRAELLQSFRQSAEELGIELKVLACDFNVDWSAACHLADLAFAVPRADDDAYIPALLDICRDAQVDLLVPTIDTELQPLSDNRARFAELGTHVAVGEPDFVRMARDKQATAEALDAMGIATPATFTLDEVRASPDSFSWPMLAKPNHGSAGRSISVVEGPSDLPRRETEPLILQELLIGPEYTINMFFDRDGKARTVIPHRRLSIRAGEVEKGITERQEALCRIGWHMAEGLSGVRGVICFQAIITEKGPFVFEINARFGGGYPLAHAAGATFAKWLLEERRGRECEAHDDWREGTRMMRYDAAVFRDG